MRAITNRIRRLEVRLAPQPDMEAYRILSLLDERCRQRLEREGVPVEELPPPWALPSAGATNPMMLTLSLEETHRRRLEIREQEQAALQRRVAGLPAR